MLFFAALISGFMLKGRFRRIRRLDNALRFLQVLSHAYLLAPVISAPISESRGDLVARQFGSEGVELYWSTSNTAFASEPSTSAPSFAHASVAHPIEQLSAAAPTSALLVADVAPTAHPVIMAAAALTTTSQPSAEPSVAVESPQEQCALGMTTLAAQIEDLKSRVSGSSALPVANISVIGVNIFLLSLLSTLLILGGCYYAKNSPVSRTGEEPYPLSTKYSTIPVPYISSDAQSKTCYSSTSTVVFASQSPTSSRASEVFGASPTSTHSEGSTFVPDDNSFLPTLKDERIALLEPARLRSSISSISAIFDGRNGGTVHMPLTMKDL